MTLRILDVFPAIGACGEGELAALRAECGLPDGSHPGELPAIALLAEVAIDSSPVGAPVVSEDEGSESFETGHQLLTPVAAPVAALITSNEHLADQELGRLLPELERASGTPMADQVSASSHQLLDSSGLSSWSTLSRRSPRELTAVPNMTRVRVQEVVALSIREAAIQALRLTPRRLRPEVGRLQADLTAIAAWARGELGLETLGEALSTLPEAVEIPEEIARAWDRLGRADLGTLAGPAVDRYDVQQAMDRFLSLEPVMTAIVRGRVYPSGARRTLDDLGNEFGVTRERVRQIEKKAKDTLEGRLEDPAFGPVSRAAGRLREELGACVAVEALPVELSRVVDAEAAGEEEADVRTRVLLELAGPYEVFERWLVRAPASSLVGATADLIEGAMRSGSLAWGEAAAILSVSGIPETEHGQWLELACRCRPFDERVVSWTGSMGDKAERLLTIKQEPMTINELAEMMGPDTNARSLMNQIQGDPRFIRRGKKHYGLSVWGGEEYTTIQDEIAQEIERQGGRAPLQHLVDRLCEQFGVSETSVRAYASDPPFVRLSGGEIAVGGEDTRKFERRAMEHTKGCFVVAGQWAIRFVVDKDVLRGSGRLIPVAVMQHLGMAPGEEATLVLPNTEIGLRWGRQATIGSLRNAARELGCEEGDLLFLRLVGDLRAEARRVPKGALEAVDGLHRLALEVGADPDEADVVGAIAVALGLDRDDRTASGIRRRLRGRQENELVQLVPDQDAEDGQHDDVLKQILGLG